jgi:hypothetical protein
MDKFIENILEAERMLYSSDHLIYTTFPVVQDKRILLQTMKSISAASTKIINTILQYDYILKRIKLDKNPKTNFETFENNCAPRYEILPSEIKILKELFKLNNLHKNSGMTFRRDKKIVIMSDNLTTDILTYEKTKEFLNISKELLKKTKIQIIKNYQN